ncbi:hypothetical protein AAFL31_22205 [Klebsiella huaxiensis]|uniref:hypothetical protein n=1 Tax=Klebsiella huaxiensis TaxID=2153354 RepID=UPI003161E1E5
MLISLSFLNEHDHRKDNGGFTEYEMMAMIFLPEVNSSGGGGALADKKTAPGLASGGC